MKLYSRINKPLLKVAGTRIPNNPKQWPTEVLKAIKNQHPYIDLSKTNTKFDILEPEDKKASGVVILENKVAIPFSIRADSKTGKPEIAELDVMFYEDRFHHLNERSLRRAMSETKRGRIYDKKKDGKIQSSNYVGHLTGDVSPLEYTNSGTMGSYAGSGLLSRIVDENNVNHLFKFLSTHRGVNSIVESLGLNDSLENLRSGLKESEPAEDMKFVFRTSDGKFAISFKNGDARLISLTDLKGILLDDFKPVFRRVMSVGWAMIRDVPVMRSIQVRLDDPCSLARMVADQFNPIQDGGYYTVMHTDGSTSPAVVCTREVDFDGQSTRKHVAILSDNRYSEGKVFLGKGRYNDIEIHPSSTSVIDVGKVGLWIDESYDSPVCTPPFKITSIITMPGKPVILQGMRMDTLSACSLVLADGLVNPTSIPYHHRHRLPPIAEQAYYIPGHMLFTELNEMVALADQAASVEIAKVASNKTLIKKSAMRWTLWGGDILERDMRKDEMAIKLASYGASDEVLETLFSMENGQTLQVYGLEKKAEYPEFKQYYVFVNNKAKDMLKQAAEEFSQAASEMTEGSTAEKQTMEDPKVMDSLLSLQFVSDETLEDLVESRPLFDDVEDKVAKLLMAARQGEESINEKATAKALKGIGSVKDSLELLAIEMEGRQ